MKSKLTFLYDGACPLCLKETNFLKKRNTFRSINFIDINDNSYNPKDFQNISYENAMSNLHGILHDGKVIIGIDVLSYAYELVGLGWVYYPAKIPIISQLIKLIYRYWAKYRLRITGRQNIQKICNGKCENTF